MANEERLIDAKPLMQNGWHLVRTGESNSFLGSMSLADVPTVDAVEVVHGRWISRICSYGTPKCSVCDWSIPYSEDSRLDATNYCPNCGAKMDGGNEDGCGAVMPKED